VTTQPTAPSAGYVRTVPTEVRHRHSSSCFWDVDQCSWDCVTYSGGRYALEHCTTMSRRGADRGPLHAAHHTRAVRTPWSNVEGVGFEPTMGVTP
jgi:hypothetical protein